MKRETMGYTLETQDFRYLADLYNLLPPDEDRDEYSAIDVEIDATVDPHEGAEDLHVATQGGVDVTDLLTEKTYRALRERYEQWHWQRERERWESAYWAGVDAKIDEAKERRRERCE